MKSYLVTVNGNTYNVAVEETNGMYPTMQQPAFTQPPAVTPPVAAPPIVTPPVAAALATPAQSQGEGSIKITAPMPGSIWEIKVSQGDKVKKNQVVAVLEAMKMENEIVSPQDGTVVGIHVAQGATVTPGQLLISLS